MCLSILNEEKLWKAVLLTEIGKEWLRRCEKTEYISSEEFRQVKIAASSLPFE